MATVKVNGTELSLAPLKSLQVAEFMDDAKSGGTDTTATIIRRSLRIVAQSLANAGTPQGGNADDAIAALDGGIAYADLDPAFRDVMDITGIKLVAKAAAGEAPAAEPTTSASSAAS